MPYEKMDRNKISFPPTEKVKGQKEAHSNKVNEIISRKPGFAERWAVPLFLIILLLVFVGTWFIKYPDIVRVKATLVAVNGPKEIKAKLDGRLEKLNVKEGQQVESFQVIGFMESRANHYKVIELSQLIDSVQILYANNKIEEATSLLSNQYLNLGELQQDYQNFMLTFQIFKQYLSSGFFLQKKALLKKDMDYFRKLNIVLLQQETMQKEDIQLSKETFKVNEDLRKDKIISALDYRNEKSKLIGKQITIPQINVSIITNESNQNNKLKEISELENQIVQQKSIFGEALNTFKAQIDDWKSKYLLISPIAGKVTFVSFFEENQQVMGNQSICFINSSLSEYYAQVYIPQNNFGKIKIGQKVFLNFLSYPSEEFGKVIGRLDFISHIPTDSGYIAKVVLPLGLITNYKKELQFTNGLKANGEIITNDLRLIQRFFYQFRKIVIANK